MVDELLTDDQEAERAKQWVRENGAFILAGIVLGLGGLFGWQQWQSQRTEVSGDASVVWEQLRSAIDGERFNEVDETLALLEAEYASTPYLDQARLAMARVRMGQNDPDAAKEQLRMLVDKGKDEKLQRLAELRLAQIFNAEQEYAEALAVLGPEETTAMAALYHELRGDALYGQGEYEAARDAYESALNEDVGGTIDRSFVQMKLDSVSVALSSQPALAEAAVAE